MRRTLVLALTTVALAACLSAPKLKYHTLDFTASGSIEPLPINIAIDQLRAAEPLRRDGIMIKKSRTEVEYYAEHLWAAALAEQVSQKLESEFAPIDPEKDTILIYGDIIAFEQVDDVGGAKACLRIDLQFRPEGASRYEKPLLERSYSNDCAAEVGVAPPGAPVDETVGAVVQALSDRLRDFAPQIRADAEQAHQRWKERMAREAAAS